ncbi:hypothetical protein, partial [Pseudovibrio sp. WM33]|uniref:hypothetical protein n=1 Tax=Pseudovibrio sp. WM33 TaxID=1735585 RepID=UPI0019D3B40B
IGEVGSETAIAVQAEGRIRPNDRLPSRDRSSIEHAVRGGAKMSSRSCPLAVSFRMPSMKLV